MRKSGAHYWANYQRKATILTKTRIHFSHANGLPASTYSYLFEMLDDSEICFVEKMGHGRFALNGDWDNLADELIASIEQQSTAPVIGIGHSAGAVVTLVAAAKRPALFKKVILLDPVLLSKRKRFVFWFFRRMGLGDLLGPTKRTLQRRAQFDNSQQAFDYFTPKSLFSDFHSRCFNDYIKYGLTPAEKGLELAFSPAIEADIFRSVITRVPANLDKVKGVLIYGDKSNIFARSDARWWRRNFPNFELVAFNGGHLFPLEKPEVMAKLLNRHIAQD